MTHTLQLYSADCAKQNRQRKSINEDQNEYIKEKTTHNTTRRQRKLYR